MILLVSTFKLPYPANVQAVIRVNADHRSLTLSMLMAPKPSEA